MTSGDTDLQPRGRLVELTSDECWQLLTTRPVGRLAWSTTEGPSVVPVNFTVDGHHVHVRTAAYSAAARECDESLVAFQVDSIDEADRSGWSVLVRGRAALRYGGARDAGAPVPWLAGPRNLGLDIEVTEVSGRRLQAGD